MADIFRGNFTFQQLLLNNKSVVLISQYGYGLREEICEKLMEVLFHIQMEVLVHIQMEMLFHIQMEVLFHIQMEVLFHIQMEVLFHIQMESPFKNNFWKINPVLHRYCSFRSFMKKLQRNKTEQTYSLFDIDSKQ